MSSICWRFLAMLVVSASASGAAAAAVQPVTIEPRSTLYFVSDNLTWADYLELRRDGRFRQFTAQHLYTKERDSGRWSVRGNRIWLHSKTEPRDIQTAEFVLYIRSRAALRQLPRLRDAVATFLQQNASPKLPASAIEKLSVPVPRAERHLRVDFDVVYESDAKRREFVKRAALQTLLHALDAHLQGRDQFAFAFELLRYRGVEWLEPVPPNDDRPSPVAEIVRQVNKHPQSRPYSVYVRVAERDFAEGVGALYPFKFHPEMNEKLRALQPGTRKR